jgi:anti-sigma regulatory factor (Ser/Thr protein kinase)
MQSRMSFRIQNSLDSLHECVQHLDNALEAANTPQRARFTAHLVLEEIGSNIIKYSSNHEKADHFSLTLEFLPTELVMSFQDRGKPFDPTKGPAVDMNATVEDSIVGGRGLLLVGRMCAGMRYQRVGDVNVLEVRVSLAE